MRGFHSTRSSRAIRDAPSERNSSRAFDSRSVARGRSNAAELPSPGDFVVRPGLATGRSVERIEVRVSLFGNANSSCLSNGMGALLRIQTLDDFLHSVTCGFNFFRACPFA